MKKKGLTWYVDATKVTAKVTVRKYKNPGVEKREGKEHVLQIVPFSSGGGENLQFQVVSFLPWLPNREGRKLRACLLHRGGEKNTFWAWPDGRQTPNRHLKGESSLLARGQRKGDHCN